MGKKKSNIKKLIIVGIVFILAAVGLGTAYAKYNDSRIERIPYSEYEQLLADGEVDIVLFNENNDYMIIGLYTEETRGMTEREREKYDRDESTCRKVIYPATDTFKEDLLKQGVIVTRDESDRTGLLEQYGSLLVSVAMLAFLFAMTRKMSPIAQGGDYIRQIKSEEIKVSFDDVIGHEEVKEDLQLLVKQIKGGVSTADISHGILFEGGAGTGKTMLAQALAHEAGVNFVSVSSSNLTELFVGMGAKRVRDAFKKARQLAPCILFFDELDAVGLKRGSQGGNREYDQTINALLTELDGFDKKGDILIIAATNRAAELDDALTRSGRFDRKIVIDAPKKWETREELFTHYLKSLSLDDTVDTERLAQQTVGFSGADIASVCREARLIALREDSEVITHEFLEEAIDKMVFTGNRSKDEGHRKDLEYVAYHEAGHAIMSLLCGRDISRISIMGMTSGVGGAVFQADKDSAFETKADIESQVMIAYAGRASEAIHFGNDKVTQGATNDITQATNLLVQYVTKLGYDKAVGLIDVSVLANGFMTDKGITDRISALSNEMYERTYTLLKENYDNVEKLAIKLLEVKTLSGEEAKNIICLSKAS